MTSNRLNLIASLFVLAGLVLLVVGLPDNRIMWLLGLGAVGVAMVVAIGTRVTEQREEEEGEQETEQGGGGTGEPT